MKFCLFMQIMQNEKSKKIGVGEVNIINGDASFYNTDGWHWLYRTRLEWIGEDTIKLSGFECAGHSPDGSKKYIYKEWILTN